MSDLDGLLQAAAAAPVDAALRARARLRLEASMSSADRAPRPRSWRRGVALSCIAAALVAGGIALNAARSGAPSAEAAIEAQLHGVGRFPLPGSRALDTRHAHVLGTVETPAGPVYLVTGLRPESFTGVARPGCAGLLTRFPFEDDTRIPGTRLYFGAYGCAPHGSQIMSGPIGDGAFLYGFVAVTTRSVELETATGSRALTLYDGYYGASLGRRTVGPVRVVERDAAGRATHTWTLDPSVFPARR